jgi:HK97 family phage prohead protease
MNRRNFALEIKEAAADGTFTGYASTFGNTDSDGEVIDKGAFEKGLANVSSVPILWAHDRTRPVGFSTSLKEDSTGLKVAGRLLVDTEDGRRARAFLKLGLELGGKPGLSIGFLVPKGGDYYASGVRHFKEVNLKEFSIVTFPANDQALATSAKGASDFDPEELNSLIQNAAGHIATANDAHKKALGSLTQIHDAWKRWYAAYDTNAPNPVGNPDKSFDTALLISETEEFLRRTKNL